MSDVHYVDADSPAEMKKCIDEFVLRCETIAQRVFHRSINQVSEFRLWLDNLMVESENRFIILHEHPLYFVAEYYGYDYRFIENSQLAREYDLLADALNWS
jgi:hypothetical protein